MNKPYDPKPLLKADTYMRQLNAKLRIMHEQYQAYAKTRQEASDLKYHYEAAQRAEFEAQQVAKVKASLSNLSSRALAELKKKLITKGEIK